MKYKCNKAQSTCKQVQVKYLRAYNKHKKVQVK